MINAAEEHHRYSRLLREAYIRCNRLTRLPMREDSVARTITKILGANVSEEAKEDGRVCTYGPTEVNRRSLLRKYRSIAERLDGRTAPPTTLHQLRREGVPPYEIRRDRPTPQQEARRACLPRVGALGRRALVRTYVRKLSAQCLVSLGRSLIIGPYCSHRGWEGIAMGILS